MRAAVEPEVLPCDVHKENLLEPATPEPFDIITTQLCLECACRSQEEYERGRELYGEWAEVVVDKGGSVSAEHGIGKLKTELLRRMYGDSGVEQMRRIIEVFNPGGRLNGGNIVGIRTGDPE